MVYLVYDLKPAHDLIIQVSIYIYLVYIGQVQDSGSFKVLLCQVCMHVVFQCTMLYLRMYE